MFFDQPYTIYPYCVINPINFGIKTFSNGLQQNIIFLKKLLENIHRSVNISLINDKSTLGFLKSKSFSGVGNFDKR